jgi:hypothetical protein
MGAKLGARFFATRPFICAFFALSLITFSRFQVLRLGRPGA